jgi:hypothetical protein
MAVATNQEHSCVMYSVSLLYPLAHKAYHLFAKPETHSPCYVELPLKMRGYRLGGHGNDWAPGKAMSKLVLLKHLLPSPTMPGYGASWGPCGSTVYSEIIG